MDLVLAIYCLWLQACAVYDDDVCSGAVAPPSASRCQPSPACRGGGGGAGGAAEESTAGGAAEESTAAAAAAAAMVASLQAGAGLTS